MRTKKISVSKCYLALQPLLTTFCCCLPFVKRNEKYLNKGLEVIDSETEILQMLKKIKASYEF